MDSKYPTLILIVLTLSAGCIGTVDPSQPTTEASTYCETDLPTAHPELSHEKEPPTYNEELSPQEATDFVHQFEENLTSGSYRFCPPIRRKSHLE
ncbi:hypothetical protein [Haloferax sp. ATB1]|uniref:hypothetical protein n=1 Tax=Haloferax sp. ATB1 TaxID=1508454 RepID=UPI000FE14800|nr:hypothetical protein [Haloferax sp. ATB1]